jgi:enediyne biosynthesis protein E4
VIKTVTAERECVNDRPGSDPISKDSCQRGQTPVVGLHTSRKRLAVSISLAILLLLLPPNSSTRAYVQQNAPTTAADRERAQKLSNLREIQRHAADLLARVGASQGNSADTKQMLVAAAVGLSTGCAFFDADGDGDLDLYVARYVSTSWNELSSAERSLTWRGGPKTMVGPVGLPGEADLFFENRGEGTFAEATDAHGLTDAARAYGFGVVATDYDGDGWIDLYVANHTNPNFLYHNLGNGRFESAGLLSGVALNSEGRAQAGMGVDAGDYDGDGRLDLIVTDFAHDTNTLYHNRDGHLFEDVTAAAGLAGPTFVRMGWGTAFFDADLDGRLDLFFANGHIYPNVDEYPQLQETFRQENQFFLNRGARFVDVSDSAGLGLQIAKSSRGLAVGDLDNDGDLDLVISNMDDLSTVLNNQQRTGHHWVAVQVEKSGRNRFCVGTQVAITAGGVRQIREIRSGGSYLSQNDLRAYFGLGSFNGSIDVEVRMPGGRISRWRQQPIDRLITLKLEDGEAR